MAVTVRQIMQLDTVEKEAKLIGGAAGISNVISYVTIMEAPDFHQWVTGGEFVLTTWYAFKDNPEQQIEAFKALAERGIAALGIKVNRFLMDIPQPIIDLADQYKLPLFAVNRETRFREIIQAISAELNNYQTNLLMEVDRHYQALSRAALTEEGFDKLLIDLAQRKRCTCFCLDADLRLLGAAAPAAEPNVASLGVEDLAGFINENGAITSHVFIGKLHVFPCIARGNSLGYLVLRDSNRLEDKFVIMANQLTTFLALKMLDLIENEQKILSTLFDDILFKRNQTEEELSERLHSVGLRQSNQYQVVVVRWNSLRKRTVNDNLLRQLAQGVRRQAPESLLIMRADEVVILVGGKKEDGFFTQKQLQVLQKILNEKRQFVIGIGPIVNFALDIEKSYRMAKRTLRIGQASGQQNIYYYKDFLVRLLLLRTSGSSEAEHLLEHVIRPLQIQEEKSKTELLATLGACIFADDLDEAAAKLHIHINTVRYRLRQIAIITGYDFFRSRGRYVLTTAYLMHGFGSVL